ncbi:uncharacterized protein K02A2.6-like [Toxorhynchites rutilus septentrionalis]|uniref:uncharacterized protein K02A2.6-like n=1 Tax=Toxorhynchites rutilus septentrionalis TaxID=329112 RepID=UPI002478FA87|nr:uncharacterized protein K02A2.6-like [Toxorhynchites rutilus septentrionalis]
MRRVPVALEEAVNHKLSEWMERDIIEEKKGPVTWVSPLVVVGKANGEPRICLDLRRVNEAVLRERHPMSLIDDFLARIGSSMIRSKLDVKDSFLQIELDETSRDAMVFLTPRAPEIFQKTMDEILVGCPSRVPGGTLTISTSKEKINTNMMIVWLRIERWVLRLQGFEYSITYIPGDQNLADVLSRLSTCKPIPFDQNEEIMIREIANFASCAVAVPWNELVAASKNDVQIQLVLESLRQDQRQRIPLEFRVFGNELGEVGGILLRGDRIVVPELLRLRILNIAHEGHLGCSMMKSTLRSSVWWPKMDRDVEGFVEKCRGCILVSAPDAPEPIRRKQMPAGPWQEIAVDFMGPLPEGQWLFVVVDYYSRFVEVVEMTSITANDTIREFSTIFGRFGIPYSMRADNGPQLNGDCKELKQFCQEMNIELVNTTPYWPQANGEVERQNRSILKRLRIAQELGKDWRLELSKFLLVYHTTNHSTTGKSPSELMFGRRIRNKLPSMPYSIEDEEVRDRDEIIKEKGKEYSDNLRKARDNPIKVGDVVYTKRMKKDHKLNTDYSSERFKVIKRTGAEATVKSLETGNEFSRQALEEEEHKQQDTTEHLADPEIQDGNIPENKQDVGTERAKRRRLDPKKFEDYVPY